MFTLQTIAKHTIANEPYPESIKNNASSSCAYRLLMTATTETMIDRVRDYVKGKICLDDIVGNIDPSNVYEYLAASKIVDLETSLSEMKNTTFKIREFCMGKSKKMGEKTEINGMNAFSTPCLHLEEINLLLANELHQGHAQVMKAPFGQERNKLLASIYTYAQEHAQILPEFVSIIEAIIHDRKNQMQISSNILPEKTTIVFKGPSGSGKSYSIRKYASQLGDNIDPFQLIQSTDNIKHDIRTRTGNIFSDQQVYLLGMSIFKMMSKEMKVHYPMLSTIQEGWFHSAEAINNLFKDLNQTQFKLDMKDFDGDFIALSLCALSSHMDPYAARPPFNDTARTFKLNRESRHVLINSLRQGDTYHLTYVHGNGKIEEGKKPESIFVNSEEIDQEIEKVRNTIITQEHVNCFGKDLSTFIGMTISEAFASRS